MATKVLTKARCTVCGELVSWDDAIDVSYWFNCSEGIVHCCSVKCENGLEESIENGSWMESGPMHKLLEKVSDE